MSLKVTAQFVMTACRNRFIIWDYSQSSSHSRTASSIALQASTPQLIKLTSTTAIKSLTCCCTASPDNSNLTSELVWTFLSVHLSTRGLGQTPVSDLLPAEILELALVFLDLHGTVV